MINSKLTFTALIGCLIFFGGCEVQYKPVSSGIPEKVTIREYRDVPNISLIDQDGTPFELDQMKGKIWIANFIFTSCNAECLILAQAMSQLQKEYADNEKIGLISFSIDPQTDKPERLKQYAEIRNADPKKWHFLTGDAGKLQTLIKDSFLVPAAVTPEERAKFVGKTEMLHSNKFAIVDASGTIRAYVEGLGLDTIKHTKEVIETLFAE